MRTSCGFADGKVIIIIDTEHEGFFKLKVDISRFSKKNGVAVSRYYCNLSAMRSTPKLLFTRKTFVLKLL